MNVVSVGGVPEMIGNTKSVYEGDLKYYFQVLLNHAQNLNKPYHNFRHMMHVTWLCYMACIFYRDRLTPRQIRNVLIAALFHDFDHSGMMGNDDLNLQRAIRGLEKHIAPEDRPWMDAIVEAMWATEFPYKTASGTLSLSAQILRDADMAQCFSVAWMQQVLFGLAAEWGKTPVEVLKMQAPFLRNLKMITQWGQQTFSQETIDSKIAEVEALMCLVA